MEQWLYFEIWNQLCGLQEWLEAISKTLGKMVQEFSRKILEFMCLTLPTK